MVLLGELHELLCASLVIEPEPLLAYARADLDTVGVVTDHIHKWEHTVLLHIQDSTA